MHPPKTCSLSNTIGLETFLIDKGVPAEGALALCMEIGRMAEKIDFGSVYTLLNESQLEEGPEPILGAVLESLSAVTKKPASISFIGVSDLCCASRDTSRKEQQILFRMTRDATVRTELGLNGGIKRLRVQESDDTEYLLREEIKQALGTHKLRRILDWKFGNKFSKILKDNIIDLWFGYCVAIMKNDPVAGHYSRLCDALRLTLPLGRIKNETNTWSFFVHRVKTK